MELILLKYYNWKYSTILIEPWASDCISIIDYRSENKSYFNLFFLLPTWLDDGQDPLTITTASFLVEITIFYSLICKTWTNILNFVYFRAFEFCWKFVLLLKPFFKLKKIVLFLLTVFNELAEMVWLNGNYSFFNFNQIELCPLPWTPYKIDKKNLPSHSANFGWSR